MAILTAGGCSSSALPPTSDITGLHFAATTTVSSNPPPAIDLTVGQIPAQNIYILTQDLPLMPAGTYGCGFDSGVAFDLTFFNGASTAVTATVGASGCRTVMFAGSSDIRYVVTNDYWSAVAWQLGVPESMLQPPPP